MKKLKLGLLWGKKKKSKSTFWKIPEQWTTLDSSIWVPVSFFWVTEPFKNLMKVLDVPISDLYINHLVYFVCKFRMDTKRNFSWVCRFIRHFSIPSFRKEGPGLLWEPKYEWGQKIELVNDIVSSFGLRCKSSTKSSSSILWKTERCKVWQKYFI